MLDWRDSRQTWRRSNQGDCAINPPLFIFTNRVIKNLNNLYPPTTLLERSDGELCSKHFNVFLLCLV